MMPVSLRAGSIREDAASAGGFAPVVVFDYDGTLIDSYEIKRQSYWRAVAEVLHLRPGDHPVVDASYERTSGAHRFEQLADTLAALKRTVSEAERDEFSRLYSANNKAAERTMLEFPAVRSVLTTLRTRYDLALASSVLHADLIDDVGRRGLLRFFLWVEGGDKRRTLDRVRTRGRTIRLFVGDTPHDEAVAAARGVPFFMVRGPGDLTRVAQVLR